MVVSVEEGKTSTGRDGTGKIGRSEAQRDLRDLEPEGAEVDDDAKCDRPAEAKKGDVPQERGAAGDGVRADDHELLGCARRSGDVDARLVAALAAARGVGCGAEREDLCPSNDIGHLA